MSEKKKFTVYVGSVVLCVGVAVLLHYVSFTNPYLQSICHLLRHFIYIGLYLVGMGDFFLKENYPKGTPSLFNNDCSDDGFLDARSYV